MRIFDYGPITTNLARTASLETNPQTVGVAVGIENGSVPLDSGLSVQREDFFGQNVPPSTPPLKVPVPTIAMPVAETVDLKTPRIAVLNSPEAAR